MCDCVSDMGCTKLTYYYCIWRFCVCVCVSEASKRIMEYIALVAGNTKEVNRVKEQLLKSNPVLESFGNAKTLRNDNSSRFGKYMDMEFDFRGNPIGGLITNCKETREKCKREILV